MTAHPELAAWVEEMARMCQPDRVVLLNGSDEERDQLVAEAVRAGELLPLNQEKWPGCHYHRTAENDVARTEELTFICTRLREDAGPTNNWMSPEEGYRQAGEILAGSMRGRTMYVIPFCMGPLGSPFSKIGVQLTDSIYVVLNMRIMTRTGAEVLAQLGAGGTFTRCLHSKEKLDMKRRLILHFPEDNAIWSVGSGYGGNALLGKKCLSLRIASHLAHREGWLAEHMLIMGVEEPNGRIEYLAAAFPSACGKTNLAMLLPPEGLKVKGYRIWTVGDDIAWMRVDTDGRLWAVNPETGFFGVAPGTNSHTNPNMMATIHRNTIFTNMVLTPDGDVWWDDGEGPPPADAWDWRGRPWRPGLLDEDGKPVPGAHPNSRFTAPLVQCPTHSFRSDQPHGVPISALIFGGRRSRLAPLVYQSLDWQHGVYVGATMASERTAAQFGKVGEVRRDPMAMLPFCGYHMGDYFQHWLDIGKRAQRAPKIFHVNWFRVDEQGNYLWPGFGENLRVLEWILARSRGEAEAELTPIGWIPTPESLDLTGLEISEEAMRQLLAVDAEEWMPESEQVREFFESFGQRFPSALWDQHHAVKQRLGSVTVSLGEAGRRHELAVALNETIKRENPYLHDSLSPLGKRLYFPKGILAQSAEATEKAKRFNATIGIAREAGQPMFLPSVMKHLAGISPAEALTYAPALGRADLRARWRDELLAKNPSLAGKPTSLPLVTSGVTHALSILGDLFVAEGDLLLLPDKFWENYQLLFGTRLGARIELYPFFSAAGGFNVEGFRRALQSLCDRGKIVTILNFPNNPTGYAPTRAEAEGIVQAVTEAAAGGCNLVAICDDAYFGLFYQPEVMPESLFVLLAGCHERVLAAKVDGPTKEEYVWGFRTGFLTFAAPAASSPEALYRALEQKAAGAIRSAISNCSHLAQSIVLKAMDDPAFPTEVAQKREVLAARAARVHQVLENAEFADLWGAYPFNSGYFMCLRLKHLDAEKYRQYLLEKHGVGVISDGPRDIRVAFSGVEESELEELFALLAQAARELQAAG